MTVFVVMMVSVTMAAFKYLNDSDYPSEYTHLYYESCQERVMDKNTDLKNFRAQKESEKLEVFTRCFVAVVVMMCFAVLKQSVDDGMERYNDQLVYVSSGW